MNPDLTDITLVVDRSGSMASVREDAEGGIASFIAEQAGEPGDALLTLVQFDTDYEIVHSGIPVGQLPSYTLVPRGMTALLDAVGRAIDETGRRLATMAEDQRPGLVIVVIVTDGKENASRSYTRQRVREMIEHQRQVYSWHFTFLGADQDAFAEAGAIGIDAGGVARYDKQKVDAAYRGTSRKVARMRAMRRSNQAVCNDFTDEEREDMG